MFILNVSKNIELVHISRFKLMFHVLREQKTLYIMKYIFYHTLFNAKRLHLC